MADIIPENLIDPVERVMGRLMFRWGIIDNNITGAVARLHRNCPEIRENEIPRAWNRRIALVKRAAKNVSALSGLGETVHDLCEACEKVAAVRDYVCHGYISGYTDAPEPTITFTKFDLGKSRRNHQKNQMEITLSAFLSYAEDSIHIASGTLALNKRLAEIFVGKKAGQ